MLLRYHRIKHIIDIFRNLSVRAMIKHRLVTHFAEPERLDFLLSARLSSCTATFAAGAGSVGGAASVATGAASVATAASVAGGVVQVGDVVIDVAGHEVTRAGERIPLTPLEFDLLVALASKPTQVFDRESLLEQVWGYRHAGDTRLVNVHVQRLRSKIEKDPENPQIVVTVRGVGYKAGHP